MQDSSLIKLRSGLGLNQTDSILLWSSTGPEPDRTAATDNATQLTQLVNSTLQ